MLAIGLLTLALPWAMLRNIEEPFLAPKLLLWLLGSWWLILTSGYRQGAAVSVRFPALAWLGGWVLLHLLLGFFVPYLFRISGHPAPGISGDALLCGFYILTALASIVALQSYVTSRVGLARISAWCCWTATAMAVYQGVQWLGWDALYTQDLAKATMAGYVYAPYAGLGNPQFVSQMQAMILPLFFLFHSKRYLLMAGVVLAAIWLFGGQFAQLTSFLVLGAYAMVRLWHRWPRMRRWGALGLIAGIALSLPIGLRHLRQDERWIVWKEAVHQVQQPVNGRSRALTGLGLQSFPQHFWVTVKKLRPETVASLKMETVRWDTAHNDWLQAGYELGAIGAALAAWVFLGLLMRGWRNAGTPVGAAWWASLVGMTAVSVGMMPWHLAHSAWLGSLIVAVNLRQPEGAFG